MSPVERVAPLAGMSVDQIEVAIEEHWRFGVMFYLAQVLAGDATVDELRSDLQGLIDAALAERERVEG